MPTIMVVKTSKEVERVVGAEMSKIEAMIARHAKESFSSGGYRLDAPTASSSSNIKTAAAASSQKLLDPTMPKPNGDCDLQIRTHDGKVVKARFQKGDSLGDVYSYCVDKVVTDGLAFKLQTNYPKK